MGKYDNYTTEQLENKLKELMNERDTKIREYKDEMEEITRVHDLKKKLG